MSQFKASSFVGRGTYVGLSSIIGITVAAGQIATVLKHGGGGTLWAGGPTVSATPLGGYLMFTGEALNINSGGTVYFASSGSTSIVYQFVGRSSGFEP